MEMTILLRLDINIGNVEIFLSNLINSNLIKLDINIGDIEIISFNSCNSLDTVRY